MATYYMRADGTATDKAAATSPDSAATSMSITTFNGESFANGDIILMSDQGGDYSERIVPPSHGTDSNNKIVLSNVLLESPKISGAGAISNCILTNKNNWIIGPIELTGATSTTVSVITTADGVELESLNIHDTYGGININTTAGSTIIRNPKIHDLTHPTNAVAIAASASDINVTVDTPNIYNVDIGIDTSGAIVNVVGGVIYDAGYAGIFDGTADVTISGGTEIYNCSGDGLVANETASLTVDGISSHDNGSTVDASSGDSITAHDTATLNVYNSTFYRNKKSGIAVAAQSSGRIINNKIYNNYDESNDIGWSTSHGAGIAIQSSGSWEIKNNATKHNGQELVIVGDGSNIDSDHNCFDDSRGGNGFYFNGADMGSFAAYQVASGQDANSINSDPLFFNPELCDFRLSPNSPAVAAGIATLIPSPGRAKYSFEIVSGDSWENYVIKAPLTGELYDADDGTLYTGETANELASATWRAWAGDQFWVSDEKSEIAIYAIVQTGITLERIDQYFGVV